MSDYGKCRHCGVSLEAVWFTEKQFSRGCPTGKTRRNISYLICPNCLKKEAIDDSYATPWK